LPEGVTPAIGSGLASVEIFKTKIFEGVSGKLVFFAFLAPESRSAVSVASYAAVRDAEIAIAREPAGGNDL
jgi:hypothetical protein